MVREGPETGQSLIIERGRLEVFSWKHPAPSLNWKCQGCQRHREVNGAQKSPAVSGETQLHDHVCGTFDGILLHQTEGGSDQEGKDSQSSFLTDGTNSVLTSNGFKSGVWLSGTALPWHTLGPEFDY